MKLSTPTMWYWTINVEATIDSNVGGSSYGANSLGTRFNYSYRTD